MERGFHAPEPFGQRLLFDNLPQPVFLFHIENDAVAAVVAHIYGKNGIFQLVLLAKIKLSQPAFRFYQFGELYIFDELQLHIV